jgi:adenylate cyclase
LSTFGACFSSGFSVTLEIRYRVLAHRREVLADGRPIELGGRAFDVLMALIEAKGAVVGKNELIRRAWPGRIVEEGNLRAQIKALRKALADPDLIRTVAGRGYVFTGEIRAGGRGRQNPTGQNVTVAAAPPGSAADRPEAAGEPAGPDTIAAPLSPPENSPPLAAPRLSIVVLPFTNLSDDKEQQYFADGITEDLTTDLSRLEDMLVISRRTAFTYRNRSADTKQIGRELSVRYVLEGSVQRRGSQVRVNAQLIDAVSDTHVWAERLEGSTADLFALQNEITSRIAVALDIELVAAEAARPIVHPDALDYILRARALYLGQVQTRQTYAEQIALYERALALDPGSEEAQGHLAAALAARVLDQMTDSPASDIVRAEMLANQALAGAPRSARAHYAKGHVLRAQQRFEEAIPEYETVLALNRNWALAIATLGYCKFITGSIEEAIPAQERAIRLSPRDPQIWLYYYWIGQAHLLQSHVGEAIRWFERARNTNPEQSLPHAYLASAYALVGEAGRAAAELAQARRLSCDDRYSSISRLRAVGPFGGPKMRALFEATYFVGLRQAGVSEE